MTPLTLAQVNTVTDWISLNVSAIAAIVIAVIALAIGLGDLLRLSITRLWAVSSVSFRESVRRRILWITPLAMLGVVAVSQLSHPFDEQDAVRQTTKYCLFASGLVVVAATLILACSNLPREIENRVIYTIVTKPATRLEILIGKVVGFARTSALILLIMGIFTFIYLSASAAHLRRAAEIRLRNLPPSDLSRDTLQHYVSEGLLHARVYRSAGDFQIYATLPSPSDPYRWALGGSLQTVIFPLVLPDIALEGSNREGQIVVNIECATQQRPMNAREMEEAGEAPQVTKPAAVPVPKMPGPPNIMVSILNPELYSIIVPSELIDVMHLAANKDNDILPNTTTLVLEPKAATPGVRLATIAIPARMVSERLAKLPSVNGGRLFYVSITGITVATHYGFNSDSITGDLLMLDAAGKPLPPTRLGNRDAAGKMVKSEPIFRGRLSTLRNQQLRGEVDPSQAGVAVYQYRGASLLNKGGQAEFELRVKIERGDSSGIEAEDVTHVDLSIVNQDNGKTAPPLRLIPETDRPTFFKVPYDLVEGGNFDVHLRTRTPHHYLGLRLSSLEGIGATTGFAYNLVKSLLILWLLSLLVIIIAIFCSTFLSWPIAVVLTLFMLLGHWATVEIGGSSTPQQMATDFFGPSANPVETRLFTEAVGGLNKLLQGVSSVLPDVSRFRVTEDIERGINIPHQSMGEALWVLGGFGIPILLLAYIFFRQKEVAP